MSKKLRLNFGDQDLPYRFGVNPSTVLRCVRKWWMLHMYIDQMAKRDQLLKTMPRKSFKNCVTIEECFEVFMERPTNLKA